MNKLLTYFNALDVKQRAEFLKKIRAGENYFRKTIHSKKEFGTKLCSRIFTATGGKVSHRHLRADWKEHWPDRTNGLVHIREILKRLEIGATAEQIAEAREMCKNVIDTAK